jgi:cytoskeletal protein CcmA (bactofilin family)
MSWFKNTDEGDDILSNANFEKRLASAAVSQPPRSQVDQKPFQPSAPMIRAESKAAPIAKPETDAPSSVFGPTLRFKGELRADEDFVMQGQIEGSIHHTQNLTIGTDGVVKGDSRARTIIVDGTVVGDLYALESICIRPTAKVQGNLMAPRVSLADGAYFNGKIDMATATRAARSIADQRPSTPTEELIVEQVLLTGTKAE